MRLFFFFAFIFSFLVRLERITDFFFSDGNDLTKERTTDDVSEKGEREVLKWFP